MSTEAQRNAANGSGNLFTLSADLSEIAPVAPIARNGYAPFAESIPGTLVATDQIVAPSPTIPSTGYISAMGNSLTKSGVAGVLRYFDYMTVFGAPKLVLSSNAGYSGQTTAYMLLHLDDIIAGAGVNGYSYPRTCIIQALRNDCENGIDIYTSLANYNKIVDYCILKGVLPIVQCDAPATTGLSNRLSQYTVGNLALKLISLKRKLPLLMPWEQYYNPDASGNYTAGIADDGAHPNDAYARAAALYNIARYDRGYGDEWQPIALMHNNYSVDAIQDCFIGASGRAYRWDLSQVHASTTLSLEATEIGNKQVMAINAASGNPITYLTYNGFSATQYNAWKSGDAICCAFELETQSLVNCSFILTLTMTLIGGGTQVVNWMPGPAGLADTNGRKKFAFFFRWGNSAGDVASIAVKWGLPYMTAGSAWSGTAKMDRFAMVNMSRLGIA